MINILKSRKVKVQELLVRHSKHFSKEKMKDSLIKYRPKILEGLGEEQVTKHNSFLIYLLFRMEDIISGDPLILNEIVKEVEEQFASLPYKSPKSKKLESSLHRCLKKIFNYDNFRSSKKWGAYSLVKGLEIKVCPYCNGQYTLTVEIEEGEKSGKGKVRPTLDHFYDKGTFPFLAISFYNLIPSCYACNSSLKHTKAFSVDTHIHPYVEGFGDYVRFTIKFKKEKDNELLDYTQILNANTEIFDIDFVKAEGESDKFYERAKQNIDDFKLREIYNLHKDYVAELILKSEIYNDAFIQMMYKSFPSLFSNKEEILRILTSNYVELDDLDKRVLAKLTRDVSKELGLTEVVLNI